MLLVWDFDVDHILTANISAVAAIVPDFDDMEETPLLNIDAVSCNCSNFYPAHKVLLPPLDNTPERGNSQEPIERNRDSLDRPGNINSDDEHWFSDESEGKL